MSSIADAGGTVLPGQHHGSDDGSDSHAPQTSRITAVQESTAAVEDPDTIPDLDVDDVLDPAQSLQQTVENVRDGPREAVEEIPEASLDDSLSIPDDTPSVQGSALSSPRSGQARSLTSPARKGSPSSLHRPFDRRFQSRLSGNFSLNSRAASPAFLNAHSRHSSMGSIGFAPASEPDESAAPWDVIKWNKLRKLSGQAFSEVGKRNFGSPTCMAAADVMVIGTSRGMVLVFDHQQNNKAVIGAGTKAVECGPVTSLAISADHTTIAASHATGHIFTWEITRPARPFLHILPIDISQAHAKRGDGHAEGSAVVHVGFLGYRRTALVSADDRGMAFSHLATRGMGAVGRTVKTTRILGRYPDVVSRDPAKALKKSSVLAFSPLPLGNVEQKVDSMGLVAMLTPYLLVIVSTTPIAQTQHKAARPKEVAAHSAMTAALAWFPAIKLKGTEVQTRNKLAYAWSNLLTVLEVHEMPAEEGAEKDKPPELQFLPRSRYKSEEAIVALQWLSRSVLAVLTITQSLLIVEDGTMNVYDSFDLLPKNIYHADLYSQQLESVIESHDEEDTSMHGVVADAFHMSFRAYKGRLFLLGASEVWWGSLTNWADRLLALMNVGDFIGAIRLATRYFAGQGEKLTIGLPEDATARQGVVGEKLFEMIAASLKFAFGKNQHASSDPIEKPQMMELAEATIAACIAANDHDFLFETVFAWYEDHDQGELFLDVLEPRILQGEITSIPPPALKMLISYFSTTHALSKLEEIICLLDASSMDIDQVTTLCKRHHLYDAYTYVWNSALGDFTTPLEEFLKQAATARTVTGNTTNGDHRTDNASKIFPYISFILTGRIYPTDTPMNEALAATAKSQIYDFFFTSVSKQTSGMKRGATASGGLMPYANLRRILTFDTPSFMSALNEAFEDSFLNSSEGDAANGREAQAITMQKTTYNRQFIVLVMLEVMSSGFTTEDTIYLDMFVARNLPKYPQYMLLSGTALQDIFTRLCHYPEAEMRDDCQLSVEYLLSVYHPSDTQALVPALHEARFYRVLKTVYRQEQQYSDVVEMYFMDEDDQDAIFAVLIEVLALRSAVPEKQQQQTLELVSNHASELLDLDVQRTAVTLAQVAPHLHKHFLTVMDDNELAQHQYLSALFEPVRADSNRDSALLEWYVRLMCRYNREHVSDYVETIKEGDLRLEEVLPTMEQSGAIDAAVVLEARSGRVREAMGRLTAHLATLGSALHGMLLNHTSEDNVPRKSTREITESIEKYTQVGVWLCQSQTRQSKRPGAAGKSSRRSSILSQPLSFDETLWVELIEAVVVIARELAANTREHRKAADDDDEPTQMLRNIIQQVFTALLAATTTARDRSGGPADLAFLRILRTFLSNAAKTAPSLSELRNVLSSIFSAYAHEQSLLSLSNAMLDKDVFVHLENVKQLRQQGWRPRGRVCEVCRQRVWGPGLGDEVWEAWRRKEEQSTALRSARRGGSEEQGDEIAGKGKETALRPATSNEAEGALAERPSTSNLGSIVAFSCRHLYHQKCLTSGDANRGVDRFGNDEHADLACPLCVGNRV